ncbi:MAG TPA: hypothetical protein VF885_17310 [Arthrobacter sp.]
MSNVYRNTNNDDIHVTTDKHEIQRLDNLENWDRLEGKDKERALAKVGAVDEPVVFSEIGEVSEQYEQHGAGTKYDPDALNEDKLAHAKDTAGKGQEPAAVGDMTVKQLREFAKDNDIELGGARSKEEITDLIQASDKLRPAQGADLSTDGDAGTDSDGAGDNAGEENKDS